MIRFAAPPLAPVPVSSDSSAFAPTPSVPASPDRSEGECANCGASLDGAFCAACGQKATVLRQPLHQFLGEAFTEYFGFDGRLWTSLRALLLHPGRLTRAYFAGQRVRYLRPLRLYLSATLLFFFLLSVLDPVEQVQGLVSRGLDTEQQTGLRSAAARVAQIDSALTTFSANLVRRERLVDSLRTAADSVRRGATSAEELAELENLGETVASARDSLGEYEGLDRRVRQLRWQRAQLAALPPDSMIRVEDWDRASQFIFPQNGVDINLPAWMPRSRPMQQLMQSRTSEQRAAALADFVRNALGQLPTVMFLLLPVFALLLKLIYVRRGWFYSEHLVFALHTHAFAFLVFAVIAILVGFGGDAVWATVAVRGLMLTLPVYFFVAQKRVYGQNWLKTGAKAVLLGGMYALVVLSGMILAIALAAAL